MKKTLLASLVLAASLFALPAFAADLHSARAAGQIGEKNDGYVVSRASSPEIDALVNEVNAKRQAEYARIGASKGQSADVTAKLAAPEIQSRLEAGAWYQDASGSWKQH